MKFISDHSEQDYKFVTYCQCMWEDFIYLSSQVEPSLSQGVARGWWAILRFFLVISRFPNSIKATLSTFQSPSLRVIWHFVLSLFIACHSSPQSRLGKIICYVAPHVYNHTSWGGGVEVGRAPCVVPLYSGKGEGIPITDHEGTRGGCGCKGPHQWRSRNIFLGGAHLLSHDKK